MTQRYDVRRFLANPEQRRELSVQTIIATQARAGIDTTREQAEAAYDAVQQEKAVPSAQEIDTFLLDEILFKDLRIPEYRMQVSLRLRGFLVAWQAAQQEKAMATRTTTVNLEWAKRQLQSQRELLVDKLIGEAKEQERYYRREGMTQEQRASFLAAGERVQALRQQVLDEMAKGDPK